MRKSQAEIDGWIRAQESRLGINAQKGEYSNASTGGALPTVTIYPSPYVIERVAHAGADARMAVDPRYAAMCERLDAELAELLSGSSARAASLPDILTID
jgi:hypothetical protein